MVYIKIKDYYNETNKAQWILWKYTEYVNINLMYITFT